MSEVASIIDDLKRGMISNEGNAGPWSPEKLGGNSRQRRWRARIYQHVKFEYQKMALRDAKKKEKEALNDSGQNREIRNG